MNSRYRRAVIADNNIAANRRLVAMLEATGQLQRIDAFLDLTATFNSVETNPPDIVLIGAGLAARDEFELMEALFRLTRVPWVVVADASAAERLKFLRGAARPFTNVAPDAVIEFLDHPPEIAGPATKPRCEPRTRVEPIVSDRDDHSVVSRSHVQRQSLLARPDARVEPSSGDARRRDPTMILIGSSTGGIDALVTVLRNFPRHCPPTLIVQHTGAQFSNSLAEFLNRSVPPHVRLARPSDKLEPGQVLIAPGGEGHLVLNARDPLSCGITVGPLQSGHRPSVDALFRSAIPYARQVVAAILTGMGRDGAEGIRELYTAGAKTIGQDRDTSLVYGMPRVAFEIGGVGMQLPLPKIGTALLTL